MTLIVFRHLPAVAAIEEQLRLQSRGLLADDEAEELPHLLDDASRELFGITVNDTFYPALPEAVRARYARAEWEANFDHLAQYARDPNAHWRTFGLDLCCDEGRSLHCLELFGRQLICALHRLHPLAAMAFAEDKLARAAWSGYRDRDSIWWWCRGGGRGLLAAIPRGAGSGASNPP